MASKVKQTCQFSIAVMVIFCPYAVRVRRLGRIFVVVLTVVVVVSGQINWALPHGYEFAERYSFASP